MRSITLGQLFELKYGKSLRKDRRVQGEVPVYGSNGAVDYHNESLVRKATIVVGRKGSIGEVHLVSTPCWPIDTTYFVESRGKYDYDLEWLYRLLKTLRLQELNRSAAIPGLNRDDLYRIKIRLPPLDDQKRIAHLLGKVEGLIARRKQHLQQLDDLLKSVFLEIFGDPVRNEQGWDKKPLAQLGNLDRGVSKHRPRNAPELLGGKYPLIQTGDISNAGTYITGFTQTYSELGFAQSKLWPAGTLCITIAANIAQTGILTFDACFPDSVVGFTADENEVKPLYVLGLFWFFQRILEKNAPAAAQKNINLKILRELEVPAPPTYLQIQFAAIVEKVEDLKSRYQQSLSDLQTIYGALSQKAFKGELDLSRVVLTLDKEELAETTEHITPELPDTQPVIELPAPESVGSFFSAKGRKALISQWLEVYLDWLGSMPFSAQHFIETAQQRLVELLEELEEPESLTTDYDFFQFGPNDYDHVKELIFRALESGRLTQAYDEARNRVQLAMAKG
jgi:type I restriction enzyme S subunit